jgi:hypothetical protein
MFEGGEEGKRGGNERGRGGRKDIGESGSARESLEQLATPCLLPLSFGVRCS